MQINPAKSIHDRVLAAYAGAIARDRKRTDALFSHDKIQARLKASRARDSENSALTIRATQPFQQRIVEEQAKLNKQLQELQKTCASAIAVASREYDAARAAASTKREEALKPIRAEIAAMRAANHENPELVPLVDAEWELADRVTDERNAAEGRARRKYLQLTEKAKKDYENAKAKLTKAYQRLVAQLEKQKWSEIKKARKPNVAIDKREKRAELARGKRHTITFKAKRAARLNIWKQYSAGELAGLEAIRQLNRV